MSLSLTIMKTLERHTAEKRNRARQIPRPTRVRFAVSLSGSGEERLVGTSALVFPTHFIEPPTFMYGCEVPSGDPGAGNLPQATASVLSYARNEFDFYTGAEVAFRVDSAVSVALDFHLTFEAYALRYVEGVLAPAAEPPIEPPAGMLAWYRGDSLQAGSGTDAWLDRAKQFEGLNLSGGHANNTVSNWQGRTALHMSTTPQFARPSLRTQFLSGVNGWPNPQTFSVVMVMEADYDGIDYSYYGATAANQDSELPRIAWNPVDHASNPEKWYISRRSGTVLNANMVTSILQPMCVIAAFRLQDVDSWLRVNGVELARGPLLTGVQQGANYDRLTLGGPDDWGGFKYWRGWIGEFIFYEGELNATQIGQVESYVQSYYGFSF